jgi:hypothetical protein
MGKSALAGYANVGKPKISLRLCRFEKMVLAGGSLELCQTKKLERMAFLIRVFAYIRRVIAVGVVGSGLHRQEFTARSPSPASTKKLSERNPGQERVWKSRARKCLTVAVGW